MRVSIPLLFSSFTISTIGQIKDVGLVTWSKTTNFVRGETDAKIAWLISKGDCTGKGILAIITFKPHLLARCLTALAQALYLWSVFWISSFSWKVIAFNSSFSSVFTLVTKTQSSLFTLTTSANFCLAISHKPSNSLPKNAKGCLYIRSRNCCW